MLPWRCGASVCLEDVCVCVCVCAPHEVLLCLRAAQDKMGAAPALAKEEAAAVLHSRGGLQQWGCPPLRASIAAALEHPALKSNHCAPLIKVVL